MPPKRKRVVLKVEQKLDIIRRLENGATQARIAEEFGIGTSTVSDIFKQRDTLKKFVSETAVFEVAAKRKVMRSAINEAVDQATYCWFLQQRASNTPLSGEFIKAQALKFNKICLRDGTGGNPDFKASCGWLQKFKERHGIRGRSVQGEILSTNPHAVDLFLNQLEEIIADGELSREQIYNCNETGLYFKVLPHRTLVGPREKTAPGSKKSKDRLTLLATFNATGTHKLPLLLIGKSKKPKCFKNVNMAALPVTYKNQKNACMDSDIFNQWFKHYFVLAVRRHLTLKGLPAKAILLIDNSHLHPYAGEMTSEDGQIRCVFLPPNTAPLLQPIYQGILETTKRIYRKNLVKKILSEPDNSSEGILNFIKSLTIKDAVYMSAEAWNAVKANTISKCWRKLNLGLEAAHDQATEVGATQQECAG
ncbi:PREDICTED: jerky protein homolog-like [Priapulus caudatus]|uniref:Jerky protein homolog-like n=1 Tax=Priapulus caudatus TaxID=37621 RepID=A0ABM1F517_PRICU|nr:PREDICTED: jerky protein homolog-like [Priapulus caudatus]